MYVKFWKQSRVYFEQEKSGEFCPTDKKGKVNILCVCVCVCLYVLHKKPLMCVCMYVCMYFNYPS
jgi:hypothetical protein